MKNDIGKVQKICNAINSFLIDIEFEPDFKEKYTVYNFCLLLKELIPDNIIVTYKDEDNKDNRNNYYVFRFEFIEDNRLQYFTCSISPYKNNR